jgi:monofunctional biosynthetic peptidoglycan transglycosylase
MIGWAVIGLLLLPYALTPLYAVMEPVSTLMIWRRIVGEPVHRIYMPMARISNNLKLAVLIAEDGRFCDHHGIDFAEIRDAIQDADNFEDMRGGSTITQQVAKNLFLWQGRSYVRKALEIPLALWIDLVLSKRRILEIYLNIAEWGPSGQFGAEAGSERAFRKSARSLSAHEAALLAASLPNPHDRDPARPGPDLRRLADLYVARSARSPQTAACVR